MTTLFEKLKKLLQYEPDHYAMGDPECVACQNGWPIFVHPETKAREHIDLFNTYKTRISEPCPTYNEYWKIEEIE